ncbi:MerR family transcriptional regulator [Campylobacter curvus]|uniref:MerR family transcriptional regulator n=1 Tax=Campylobacter curvus TaxID=200 RepID=UPI00146FF934|nr:MerR family transcriptional regulator [Campylobacter curvus]
MLKMNELIQKSDTPKSTILYYVKEGLLPEPEKPKPNLYLYEEKCVQIIEFIKYLQINFNSSIAQIKALFSHPSFDMNNPYETLFKTLELIMGANFTRIYSIDELAGEFKISKDEISKLVEDGFLMPRDGVFTGKEREILSIIVNSSKSELGIIKAYVNLAQQLSKDEVALTIDSLKNSTKGTNETLKHLFDILLIVKPYILNMHTLNTYKKETK